MSNNLEKFIQKNRREFDADAPAEKIWEGIENTLPIKKENRHFSINDVFKWSAAAAIVFATLTSIYFIYIKKYSHESKPTVELPMAENLNFNQDDISRIAPEHATEIKKFYNSISTSQQELKEAASGHPELYRQFLDDLAALDSSYQTLKKQAMVSVNKDVLIQAMMQNLQLQVQLLYRQLMIADEIKLKTKNNEKSI